jgi:hypothetical protein
MKYSFAQPDRGTQGLTGVFSLELPSITSFLFEKSHHSLHHEATIEESPLADPGLGSYVERTDAAESPRG